MAQWVGLTGLTVSDGHGDAVKVALSLSECVTVEFLLQVTVEVNVALAKV